MKKEKSFFLAIRVLLLGSFMWLGLLVGSGQIPSDTNDHQEIYLDAGQHTIDQASAVLSQFDWSSFTTFQSSKGTASFFQQLDFKYRMQYVSRQSLLILKSTAHLFNCIKEKIALNERPPNSIKLQTDLSVSLRDR